MKVIIKLFFFWIGLISSFAYAKIKSESDIDSLFITKNVFNESFSNDNKWIITTNIATNKSKKSTLIGLENNYLKELGAINSPKFSSNNQYLMVVDHPKNIVVYSLESLNKIYESSEQIKNYTINWNSNGSYVGFLTKNDQLGLYHPAQNKEGYINGIIDFRWHPKDPYILLINSENKEGYEISEYNLTNHQKRKVLLKSKNKVQIKEYASNGESLSVVEHTNNQSTIIHYWKGDFYRHINLNSMIGNHKISLEEVEINDDGNRLLIETKDVIEQNDDVLVWDTQQKWNPYRINHYNKNVLHKSYFLWTPSDGEIRKLNSDLYPSILKDIKFNYILKFNILKYEPLYKQEQFIDLYYENLLTKENRLVTSSFYYTPKTLQVSPSGKLILFFKDSNWWLHDIVRNVTTNLTVKIPTDFEDKNGMVSILPYGFGSWSYNEKYVFLYDEYDIWKINIETFNFTRCTKGLEYNIIHRNVMRFPSILDKSDNYFLHKRYKMEDKQEISMLDANNLEYSLYTTSNGLSDFKLNNKQVIFTEQAYNYSPLLKVIDIENDNIKSYNTTESSSIDSFYDLIITKFDNQEDLRGTLLYPYNYDKNKKYPLIVQIYEDKSNYKNEFVPLTDLNSDGFNVLKYLNNGYFVYLPQIRYQVGNPGVSASKSIDIHMEYLLKNYKSINKNSIGLIGHSFGGYEAAFIATQSNYFKTIVVGAAVFDVVNWYHDINEEWMKNQDWRLEAQQFRLGGSFYEMKENYINNSPLSFIENVDTPILLWTGKKDTNINYKQSVFMYNALKRLNKEARLLLINNEAHYMVQPKNQFYLTNEIYNWFENHLK